MEGRFDAGASRLCVPSRARGGAEGSGSGGGLGVGACFMGRGGACVVLVIREIPDTCLSITWFR